MRQQLPMQPKRLETQYLLLFAIGRQKLLAYTATSASGANLLAALAPLDRPLDALLTNKTRRRSRHRSVCKAGPKTSVVVTAARGDTHASAQPRTLAIATVRRQRASTVAAGATNSPTKGAAA